MGKKETFIERFGSHSYLCRSVILEKTDQDGSTDAIYLDLMLTVHGYKILEDGKCKPGNARLPGGIIKEKADQGAWQDYINNIKDKGYNCRRLYGDMGEIDFDRIGTWKDPFDQWKNGGNI